jgi:SNF2 family DNA or RNA helicase
MARPGKPRRSTSQQESGDDDGMAHCYWRSRPPAQRLRPRYEHNSTRIALTGTPIENRLSDLWSIFDFINPGLLGSAKEFSSFVKRLADRPHNPYGPLRDLVRPYILRRLKIDKNIIADLPDKTEVKTFCPLSRKQAALYQQAVNDLSDQLDDVDGIQRRGIVLASLMRLKQICNHPSHWLGDGSWAASGGRRSIWLDAG